MTIKLYPGLYATPFHARTAARNVYNAWSARGMFTVPSHFGNLAREALAARFSAIVADLSPSGRLRIHGPGAARFVNSAFRTETTGFSAGTARQVFWTSDGGGVRGLGILSRHGEDNFLLESQDTDTDWFAGVASRFDAKVRDERAEKGVLLIAGVFAPAVLKDAGLNMASALPDYAHGVFDCNGISVTVARRPVLNGYELCCSRDDSIALFDRLSVAGRRHALTLIGQDALDLLYLESGVLISGLDFFPSREIGGETPPPASLGIGPPMNGSLTLAGVECLADATMDRATLYRDGTEVGRVLRSGYSFALRRTIALANVAAEAAAYGTELRLNARDTAADSGAIVRVVPLPFLSL